MPTIQFDQAALPPGDVDKSRSDIVLGVAVTITATSVGTAIFGVLGTSVPSGSVLTGTGLTRTLTPDVVGTYRIRVIDAADNTFVTHTFTVATSLGQKLPAFNERASADANDVDTDPGSWIAESETNEGGSYEGWHPHMVGNLLLLEANDLTLLPLDGSRAMTGVLDMGAQAISNAGAIASTGFTGPLTGDVNTVSILTDGPNTQYLDRTGVYSVPTAGDFSGPAGSGSGNLVSFADTTGKVGADSGIAASAVVLSTVTLTAGIGMVGGGDLSANRTFDIQANGDGSIIANVNDIQVGVLANDTQHGERGGGSQHAVATVSVNGFMSSTDKTAFDLGPFLPLTGGTMSGNIAMGTSAITGVSAVTSGAELSLDDVGAWGGTLSQAGDRALALTATGEVYDGVTSLIGGFNAVGNVAAFVGSSTDTGIISGGVVTINGGDPAKVDVAAGVAQHVDPLDPLAIPTRISFGPFIGESLPNIATTLFTALSISSVGALVKSNDAPDGEERRTNAVLQDVSHLDLATVTSISTSNESAFNVTAAILDYIKALGSLNSGNQYSAAATDLTIAKSPGTTKLPFLNGAFSILDPNTQVNAAQSPAPFAQTYIDSAVPGGFNISFQTNVPVGFWDDKSDTLQTVGINNWAIYWLDFFNNGTALTIGQAEYNTLEDAEVALFTENPVTVPAVANVPNTRRTALIAKGNASDLSNPAQAKFIPLQGVMGSGGDSAVLSIFGRTGSVSALAGDYNAAQITFTPDGDIAATEVQAAIVEVRDDADTKLATKAANATVFTAGAGMTGGGDLSTARTFDVIAGNASIVVTADAIVVGVLQTDAMHGVRGGGTQHALATGSLDGFLAQGDFTKIGGIETGAEVNVLPTGYMVGVHVKNNVATPLDKVDIAVGRARDSTDVYDIPVGSVLSPSLTFVGANGLDTGTRQNSSLYAVYIIDDTSSPGEASLFSLNQTSPALPGTFDVFRRVATVQTNSIGNLDTFLQSEDEGSGRWMFRKKASLLQFNGTATGFTNTSTTALLFAPLSASHYSLDLQGEKTTTSDLAARVEMVPDGWNETGGQYWTSHCGLNTTDQNKSSSVMEVPTGPGGLVRYRVFNARASIYFRGYKDQM